MNKWVAYLTKYIRVFRLEPYNTSTEAGRSAGRYRRIFINSLSSILARIALAGLGLFIVPLILTKFGKEQFGLWATVTATTTWITLFDFGIVNGLVIAVSESFGKGNKKLAASYVNTAFIFLISTTLVLGIVALSLVYFLPLRNIFPSGSVADDSFLRRIILAAVLPMILTMPFTIIRQVYAGYQEAYISNLFSLGGSITTIVVLYLALSGITSLPTITAVYLGIPGAILGINYVRMIKQDMPWLSPKRDQISTKSLNRLFRSSIPLLFFQLGVLLVNQTQPIVLAHRSNLVIVADYTVGIRLQQALTSVILMSTIAFSPSFREASERGDHGWVRKAFFRMVRIRISLAIIFGALLFFFGNQILNLWLGSGYVSFGPAVWVSLAVLMLVSTWVTAYSDLLVIMDRIWIQVALVIGNGLSILLLTYYAVPTFGVLGAVIATTGFSLMVLSWLMPILARSVLKPGIGTEIAGS